MRRRGQIFLILTILVISFMIGITSVLLDIRTADYLDPAPDSDVSLNAWETTTSAIDQIMEIQLSQNSNAQSPNNTNIDLSTPLANLEAYLSQRGLVASITGSNVQYRRYTPVSTNTTEELVGSFSIYIKSSSLEINQKIEKQLQYNAYSDQPSELYVSKILDGQVNWISGSSFNTTVTDNENGSYSGTSGDYVEITTPSEIFLIVQIT